jgi:hypothetical protein
MAGDFSSMFRSILARDAGTDAEAADVAGAAWRTCERLARHLTPLIGESGFATVYARSLDVAQRQFPQLESVRAAEPSEGAFDPLHRFLAHQPPAAATEAAVALFSTLAELLTSLIGEQLTLGLLHEAWPGHFADGQEKSTA